MELGEEKEEEYGTSLLFRLKKVAVAATQPAGR